MLYICKFCGNESDRTAPQCPTCKKWGALTRDQSNNEGVPMRLSEIPDEASERTPSGFDPVDDVIGGGFVDGSIILLGGEPGIGKSTLILQVANAYAEGMDRDAATDGDPDYEEPSIDDCHALYIASEESLAQIKLRAVRLGLNSSLVRVMNETSIEKVFEQCEELAPILLIIDSIQMMLAEENESAAGSVSQLREVVNKVVEYCKPLGTVAILTCHVTKDGDLAGPKTVEHMVDTVLYFEAHPGGNELRVLRATKNRFGDTKPRATFQMSEKGLVSVE